MTWLPSGPKSIGAGGIRDEVAFEDDGAEDVAFEDEAVFEDGVLDEAVFEDKAAFDEVAFDEPVEDVASDVSVSDEAAASPESAVTDERDARDEIGAGAPLPPEADRDGLDAAVPAGTAAIQPQSVSASIRAARRNRWDLIDFFLSLFRSAASPGISSDQARSTPW